MISPTPDDPAVPETMADALTSASPRDALLAISASSESLALALARDLSSSLSDATSKGNITKRATSNADTATTGRKRSTSDATSPHEPSSEKGENHEQRYPISLPSSFGTSVSSSGVPILRKRISFATDRHHPSPSPPPSSTAATDGTIHPLTTASLSSESILSSLSKIASGGTKASAEMRRLESERYELDALADDIDSALKLRAYATAGADALSMQNYPDAARAVREYRSIRPTDRAVTIAGEYTVRGYERTRDVLQKAVLGNYELAVAEGNVESLSRLTPLLGMLELAEKGVGLYLRYSQGTLAKAMDGTSNDEDGQVVGETTSRAAQRRAAQKKASELKQQPVCHRLAKVFNEAVTHLRHHLPMVAYALGEADGDAALVQLVHLEVEKRAVEIIREYAAEKHLAEMENVAERVATKIEDKYVGGIGLEGGGGEGEGGGLAGGLQALMGMDDQAGPAGGKVGSAPNTPPRGGVSMTALKVNVEENDCGFTAEVGRLSDVDAAMDEAALCLQHTESYERFIRHAVEEVKKARELRRRQKIEERRIRREREEEKRREGGAGDGKSSDAEEVPLEEDDQGSNPIEILPPHTQLNEVVAEIGGYYSGLERSLLLASMQRAFLTASYPDERNYSPISIVPAGRTAGQPGCRALQTSVVEECLYASQRSTMRAFATGHTGTASAAANFCADSLGRVLLEVLVRRAETGISLLKPGEGLLPGQGGLFGQAAGLIRGAAAGAASRAKKGGVTPKGGGVVGVVGQPGGGPGQPVDELMRHRIELGIARACANLNDLEVAVDYTQRLETKFTNEIDTSYPRGHETEQLRMCVKSLGPVTDSFRNASSRSMETLVSTIMTRVRSIVNDAVGQESTTSTSFMGTTVMGGGKTADRMMVRMNYDLDDGAYEMVQVSEGYISRLCSGLDELIEPLRVHLAPRLSDALLIGVLGGASKRIESAIRRSRFTALGALSLDSDIRYFLNFAKERVDSPELTSNVALHKACNPLARLSQIALLMNVDDLDDVLDLISSSKRKGNWDLKLDDAKAFLNLRVDFEGRKVNELLRISEGEE